MNPIWQMIINSMDVYILVCDIWFAMQIAKSSLKHQRNQFERTSMALMTNEIGIWQFWPIWGQKANVKISKATLIRIMHKPGQQTYCTQYSIHLYSKLTHIHTLNRQTRRFESILPVRQARNFKRCQFQSQFNAITIFLASFLINNKLIFQMFVVANWTQCLSTSFVLLPSRVYTFFSYKSQTLSKQMAKYSSSMSQQQQQLQQQWLQQWQQAQTWPSNCGWSLGPKNSTDSLSLCPRLWLPCKICLFRISKPKVIDLINCHRHVARPQSSCVQSRPVQLLVLATSYCKLKSR